MSECPALQSPELSLLRGESFNMTHGAWISPCHQYRYTLWRQWAWDAPAFLIVVGLNPSTADASQDDPTIRRCIGFAQRMGYAGLWMLNLYAYRATLPAACFAAHDPCGPENQKALRGAMMLPGRMVAAWGARARVPEVQRLLDMAHGIRDLYCWGRTRTGAPKHPLYLPASTQLMPYG